MLKALLNILRGRPTIYRAQFAGPIHLPLNQHRLIITGCTVDRA